MIWYVLAIIALLLLFLAVTLWQSARLELEYWREGNDDRVVVHLRGPYGIVFQQLEIPLADLITTPSGPGLVYLQRTKDALGGEQRTVKTKVLFKELGKLRALWRKLKPLWDSYRPALEYMLSRVHLEVLTWETKVGIMDAAANGMLVGAVWALKGMIVTWLQRRVRIDESQSSIVVSPYFNHSYFSTYFHCIFTIRLVHVINVQRHLLWYKLRQRKR
jgi:hypothetical protein